MTERWRTNPIPDYLADVGLFAGELRGLARGALVVVDEVQRLPALLNDPGKTADGIDLLPVATFMEQVDAEALFP